TIEGNHEASIPIIPAALAHARLAADNIIADLAGRSPAVIDFAPRGMLVSLGERDAVVDVMGLKFSGYLAWLFWNALHLYKLVGFRKQIQVALDWSLAQFFPRDSSMMRQPPRCPICAHPGASPRERERGRGRMSRLLRVGVLASGRGSNLQALLEAGSRPDYPARVVVVVSDREDARALARARAASVSSLFVNPKDHGDRSAYDAV